MPLALELTSSAFGEGEAIPTRYTCDGEDISPALGVVWDQKPGTLAWEFHLARSVRVPTWIELFGHRGGIVGNRELQPEEIDTVDLGLNARRAGHQAKGDQEESTIPHLIFSSPDVR